MSAAFDRGFERVKNGYGNVLALALVKRKFVLGCFALLHRGDRRARARHRHRLLPDLRRRHPQDACPRAARHAARGNREDRGPGRGEHPPGHPGQGAAHHQLDHRPAVLAQSRLRAERQHQRHGRRTADLAQPRPQADRGVSAADPRQAQRRISRHAVLFPDRRHRQPGAQLRPGGADRHPDPGFELPARLCFGAAHSPGHPEDPGRGRSPHRPGAGLPDHPDRRRSPARRADGHRPARRRQQHADVACRQRAGRRRPTISIRRPA